MSRVLSLLPSATLSNQDNRTICMQSYNEYSWRQKSAYKTDTGSAQSLVRAVNAMSLAVRPDSVSRQACALAGVTAAVEKACAASCKALTEAAT